MKKGTALGSIVTLMVALACGSKTRAFEEDQPGPADTCDPGTHECNDACVPNASVTACGDSCQECPAPDGGEAACIEGACQVRCPTGTALCGTKCHPGACKLAPLGDACKDSADCASGYCVESVCCNSLCAGECQSCSLPDKAGACTFVEGEPPAGKPACGGAGACQGSCSGKTADCVFPDAKVQCGEASCSSVDGAVTAMSHCDGQGSCKGEEPQNCGDYRCDGSECRTTCRNDGDCRGEAKCINASVCAVFKVKRIAVTKAGYTPDGIAGADAACQAEVGELGGSWKALIVGGTRVATVTPNQGNGRQDWVVDKFTEYYNMEGRLVWTTTDVPLLGVKDGQRVDLLNPAFENIYAYPWAGYDSDWTTSAEQNCDGWKSTSDSGGGFAYNTLLPTGAIELCTSASRYVCVEQ